MLDTAHSSPQVSLIESGMVQVPGTVPAPPSELFIHSSIALRELREVH